MSQLVILAVYFHRHFSFAVILILFIAFKHTVLFEMNREQILRLLLLRRRRRRRRFKNRLIWVHPINERRREAGAFHTLFEELRQDDTKFFNYFRMSVSSFDGLLERLKDTIQRKNTKMRNCIQPVEMLAITLR